MFLLLFDNSAGWTSISQKLYIHSARCFYFFQNVSICLLLMGQSILNILCIYMGFLFEMYCVYGFIFSSCNVPNWFKKIRWQNRLQHTSHSQFSTDVTGGYKDHQMENLLLLSWLHALRFSQTSACVLFQLCILIFPNALSCFTS